MAQKKKNKRNSDKTKFISSLTAPKLNLASETKHGIAVIIFVVLGVVSALSLAGYSGGFGNWLASVLAMAFGVIAYLIPLVLLLIALVLLRKPSAGQEEDDHIYFRTYFGVFLLVGSITGLIHIFYLYSNDSAFDLASAGRAGGYLGAIFAAPAFGLLGFWAGAFVLVALIAIALLITFNVSLIALLPAKKSGDASLSPDTEKIKINSMENSGFVKEQVVEKNKALSEVADETEVPVSSSAAIKHGAQLDNILKLDAISVDDRRDWKLPPFDLLDDNKTEVDSGNIESNVAIIKKTLADFGIEVEMGEVNVGPTVTQYTLRPAIGVKLSQIGALQNDLALALSAHSLRMELPIPGKALVGIEVPNKATAIVRLREVMQTNEFISHKSKLAIALGRDVAGRPQLADLAKMPHLLIAGATGTGKSVAINSLLISILYRNTPQEVKFIVIDPKRVELNLYNGIPHLLTPVVTDYQKAINALKWSVAEMDRRYKLLAEANKRNIIEYNEGSKTPLSYVVIIVDELADLMAVAQTDVEAAIVRLAQMARAVGIHLVVATQRPSVDIITGLIKANITARIAFAVASQVDSRTILDSSGAEKLLGNGDMLFVSAEFNKPKRIQGAYIGEKEVRKVVDFFKVQTGAVIYNEEILEKPKKGLGLSGHGGEDMDDDLFLEAKAEVMRAGKASASLLQRRLRVGYARAARLLDILEERGIIGPGDGAKPREIYGVSEREDDEDMDEKN